jgi:ADP-heptose:LPS heptosyltransferase
MHYELEFGGGLGDVFFQMFQNGTYNVLRDLGPDDTALVDVISHNPFAGDLFTSHRNAHRIEVRKFGYWPPVEDVDQRLKHNLPPSGRNAKLPIKDSKIEFFPSVVDLLQLSVLGDRPYLVLAASASLLHKQIPDALVERIIDRILLETRVEILVVGQEYHLLDKYGNERYEYRPNQRRRVCRAINNLSVQGVAFAVAHSAGVICSHSAVGILGWCLKKPQLLLYPKSHYEPFIAPVPRTLWGFGLDYLDTVACDFREFKDDHIEQFIDAARLFPA